MIEPYYSKDGITVYCADAKDVIDSIEHIDCIITSPPYNLMNRKGGGVSGGGGIHKNSNWSKKAINGWAGEIEDMQEQEYQIWLVDLLGIYFEKCKGLMWVNHKIRYVDGIAIHPARFLPWDIHSEVIWNRNGSMALNCRRYPPSHEYFLGFGKPYYWDNKNDNLMSVWTKCYELRKHDHPCPFPIEFINRLILSSTREGDVVVDPFAGSGTTLVSAKKNNRKVIGIEKQEKYCELIVNRLAQNYLSFDEEEEEEGCLVNPQQETAIAS